MTSKTKPLNITPVGDRILVQRREEDEEEKDGIYIQEKKKKKPQEASVIALGSGRRNKGGKILPFEVKAGDRVLLSKYGGTEVTINDEDYQLVREEDILAILS